MVLQEPKDRVLPAKIGALSRWAFHREAGLKQLAGARAKLMDRFANESEKKLYFTRLAAKSAASRKAKKARAAGTGKE